ncbi:MAG: beta-glucosidase, partial [Cyclobacteriaceae bacterium]
AGEEKEVKVEIPKSELAYYDELKGWTIESGIYTFLAGSSSRDIRRQVDLLVD